MSYKRAKKSIMKNSKWKNYFDKYAQLQMIKEWVKKGVCELYFYDESGFSLNSNIPYRWSPVGEALKIPANRFSKRINVLGFLNTQTKDLFHAMTTDKVDTKVVIDVFDSFAKQIKKTTICVLDNASIHTSKKFKEKIDEWKKLGLHLLYLPPYSPELNPIEMLWREMKYTWMDLNVLNSFESFHQHIQEMLNFFGSKYDINFG
jgi:transposase